MVQRVQELAVTQANDEEQVSTHKEFAHSSQTPKDVEFKTNEVSAKSSALSQAKADLDSAKRRLGLASEYLDKLKPDCMNSSITHADRVAAREQEIQLSKERVRQRTVEQTVDVPVAM